MQFLPSVTSTEALEVRRRAVQARVAIDAYLLACDPALLPAAQAALYAYHNALNLAVPVFLGQIATGTFTNDGTAARYFASRSSHLMRKRGGTTGLQLVYTNWRLSSNAETNAAGALTIKCAIEYPAGTFTPVTFSGSRTGTAAAGANLVSDRASVYIPQDAEFWIRQSGDSGNSAQIFQYHTKRNGEQYQVSASALPDYVDGGGSWTAATAATQSAMFMPAAIIDYTATPAIGVYGSSTPTGRGDISAPGAGLQGTIARAYGAYPLLNAALSGDQLQNFRTSNAKRMQLADYCSHIVLSNGSNDVVFAGREASVVYADAQAAIALFTAKGKRVAFTTITPRTTSTDNWATVANQTVTANEAKRLTFNSMILSGTGAVDIIDMAPYVKSPGTELWLPNYTTDGVHQATVAAIASLPAINPSNLIQ